VRPEWKVIMNTDVEDLLREGMERFAADLRAPAGLACRVAARRRHRRLALRSVAGAAAALTAGAVALVAVVVPGAGGSAAAASYVVKRADSALSVADPGEIAQMTVATRGPAMFGGTTVTATAEEWSYGGRWRSVTYSSAGHPVYDEGSSTASVYTLVNYQTKEWARQPGLGRPSASVFSPRNCGPVIAAAPLLFQTGLPGIGFSASSPPSTVARALHTAISCGTLAVAGRQRVDGIEAIELTSRPGSPISETIWVNPGTYLPVRVVVHSAFGAPALLTANITWLSPTAQNLARLTVPIPAGFRQVPLAEAVRPILPKFPGGPVPKFPGSAPPKFPAICPASAVPVCVGGPVFWLRPAERLSFFFARGSRAFSLR
jgi:hypothetical protein